MVYKIADLGLNIVQRDSQRILGYGDGGYAAGTDILARGPLGYSQAR